MRGGIARSRAPNQSDFRMMRLNRNHSIRAMMMNRQPSRLGSQNRSRNPPASTLSHSKAAISSNGPIIGHQDLHEAARLALLTGLTYLPMEAQPAAIKQEGLTYIASSRDKFTSWIVADSPSFPRDSSSGGNQTSTRFILLRGVQWGAKETSLTELTLQLGKSWPSAFASVDASLPSSTQLNAHHGIKEIALESFAELAPFLRHLPPSARVIFSGHSLGGSIAQIIWALTLIHGHRTSDSCSVQAFGSPPIFSLSSPSSPPASFSTAPSTSKAQKTARDVLDLLPGPPSPSSCRNWIQSNDPIPRAMTLSDPYLQLTLQNSLVRSILDRISSTSSSISPQPLYKHVGEVMLIKPGCQISKIRPGEPGGQDALRMPLSLESISQLITRPHVPTSWLLDHHHLSYQTDLQRAAKEAREKSEGVSNIVTSKFRS